LKMPTIYGPAQVRDFCQPTVDDIYAASDGRINIKVFASGELMPDDQGLAALNSGTIDFLWGIGPNVATPIDLIDFDCFPPFAWDSSMDLWSMYEYWGLKELWDEAYNELGFVHHGWLIPTDPIHLLTTKPIQSLDDLQGLKVNADRSVSQCLEHFGAEFVQLPVEEFYSSGKSGIVDGLVWCGAMEAYTNGWYEAYPYFLANPLNGNARCWIIARKDLWDSFSEADKALIDTAFRAAGLRTTIYYWANEPKARLNYTLTYIPDEEWAEVEEYQYSLWDEWAQQTPRLAEFIKILEDYNEFTEMTDWRQYSYHPLKEGSLYMQ